MTRSEMNQQEIERYRFPVQCRPVMTDTRFGDDSKREWSRSNNHKAIHRVDTGELISIVSDTYQPVSNSQVIDSCLESFEKLGIDYRVRKEGSYFSNARMNLYVSFPDIKIDDGDEGELKQDLS